MEITLSNSTVSIRSAAPPEDGRDEAGAVLRRLAEDMGWAANGKTFGKLIRPGAKVVVKPNLVMHENEGPWGMEPLITSPPLIRAVAEAVLETEAGQLT